MGKFGSFFGFKTNMEQNRVGDARIEYEVIDAKRFTSTDWSLLLGLV